MARPRILVSAGNADRIKVGLNSTRPSLEMGDFISVESNEAVLMDAVGEDVTFAGYLINEITTGQDEPDKAVVGIRGQLLVDCDSADGSTYTVLSDVKYSAENKVLTAAADTIAWVARSPAATTVRLEIIIDVPALQKLFAVAA